MEKMPQRGKDGACLDPKRVAVSEGRAFNLPRSASGRAREERCRRVSRRPPIVITSTGECESGTTTVAVPLGEAPQTGSCGLAKAALGLPQADLDPASPPPSLASIDVKNAPLSLCGFVADKEKGPASCGVQTERCGRYVQTCTPTLERAGCAARADTGCEEFGGRELGNGERGTV